MASYICKEMIWKSLERVQQNIQQAHSFVEKNPEKQIHNFPRKRSPNNHPKISVANPGEVQLGVGANEKYIKT